MANLLDVSAMPDVQDNILKYLGVREIKALRLTSHETHSWVQNSSVNFSSHWGGVAATIDFNRKPGKLTFDSLIALPFVVSELTLQNYSSPSLLNVNVTGKFLREKGAGVKTLRLERFFGCRYDDELAFLEGLTGLQELSVDYLDLDKKFSVLRLSPVRIPTTMRNLRSLDIRNEIIISDTPHFWEIVSAPRFTKVLKSPIEWQRNPGEFLGLISRTLQNRRDLENEEKTNYAHVDLRGFPIGTQANTFNNEMRQFLRDCREHSVRILNVCPILLAEHLRFAMQPTVLDGTRETVESIVGWHWSLKRLQSQILKELRIPSTSSPTWRNGMPVTCELGETYSWPNLQLLHVTFDTHFGMIEDVTWCIDLIRTLHLGPVYMAQSGMNASGFRVDELGVIFKRGQKNATLTPPGVLCPSSIAKHYPNIKILKITGWDAHDHIWIQLWDGLSQLEELYIDDCRNLGLEGFTGRFVEEPVFFKFQNLKKLTLKLNDMPKIRDLLFRDVISKLRLDEFYLYTKKTRNPSSRTLSRQALEYLAEGPFGESVKKFPFDTFALLNTTDKEQQKLKFRFPYAHY